MVRPEASEGVNDSSTLSSPLFPAGGSANSALPLFVSTQSADCVLLPSGSNVIVTDRKTGAFVSLLGTNDEESTVVGCVRYRGSICGGCGGSHTHTRSPSLDGASTEKDFIIVVRSDGCGAAYSTHDATTHFQKDSPPKPTKFRLLEEEDDDDDASSVVGIASGGNDRIRDRCCLCESSQGAKKGCYFFGLLASVNPSDENRVKLKLFKFSLESLVTGAAPSVEGGLGIVLQRSTACLTTKMNLDKKPSVLDHMPVTIQSTVYNNWDIVCLGVYERAVMYGAECSYSQSQSRSAIAKFSKKKNPVMTVALQGASHSSLTSPVGVVRNDNKDFATGHFKGEIVVWHGAVDSVFNTYNEGVKSSTIQQTLHWHAHPVTALCYSSSFSATSKFLYSGGEEAVLCTWGVEGTASRTLKSALESENGSAAGAGEGSTQSAMSSPVQFIPRISLGGIRGISIENDRAGGVMSVVSSDDSLKVLNTVDQRVSWEIKGVGLARSSGPKSCIVRPSMFEGCHFEGGHFEGGHFEGGHFQGDSQRKAQKKGTDLGGLGGGEGGIRISFDAKRKEFVMAGANGAPGLVCWMGTSQLGGLLSRSQSLDVANWNRVSRKDPDGPRALCPRIANFALSPSGCSLVAVEGALNDGGRGRQVRMDDEILYERCTMKFYGLKGEGGGLKPEGVAPTPHGEMAGVSAVDVFDDAENASPSDRARGLFDRYAGTISAQNKSFRIWKGVATCTNGNGGGGGGSGNNNNNNNNNIDVDWKCLYKVGAPSAMKNRGEGPDTAALCFSSDGSVLAVAFNRQVTLWSLSAVMLCQFLVTHNVQKVGFNSVGDKLFVVSSNRLSCFNTVGTGGATNGNWAYNVSGEIVAACFQKGYVWCSFVFGSKVGEVNGGAPTGTTVCKICENTGKVLKKWKVQGTVSSMATDGFGRVLLTTDGNKIIRLQEGLEGLLVDGGEDQNVGVGEKRKRANETAPTIDLPWSVNGGSETSTSFNNDFKASEKKSGGKKSRLLIDTFKSEALPPVAGGFMRALVIENLVR